MSDTTFALSADPWFQERARRFADLYGQRRRITFELGEIAATWFEHYSRSKNAERLSDALFMVTGLKLTGRSLRYFRDIFEMDVAWRQRGRAKSRNDFQIRHVIDGHLRVVAGATLPTARKCQLLDHVERQQLTVKRTTGLARQWETAENRKKRAAIRRMETFDSTGERLGLKLSREKVSIKEGVSR